MALKFQDDAKPVASNSNSNNNNSFVSPRPSAPPAVVDDESVARALHEQQVRAAAASASNEERDAKLARELFERENRQIENVDEDERLARRLFDEEKLAKEKADAEKQKRDAEAARLVHIREVLNCFDVCWFIVVVIDENIFIYKAELLRQERARVANSELVLSDAELARRLDDEEKEAERRRLVDEQVAQVRRAAEAELKEILLSVVGW